jgi:hypothetical protein
MMSSGGGKIAGPALIIVGLLMLLGQMGMPAFGTLWPLILLAIGVGMILRYRQGGEDSGLVFSGTLLILLTVIFLSDRWGWFGLGRHWPSFVGAVGLAFLVMARVDSKRRDAMVPGFICLGVALVFYFFSLGYFVKLLRFLFDIIGTLLKVVIPLGLIGFGGWMLFHDRQEEASEKPDFPEKVTPRGPEPEDVASAEPAADGAVAEVSEPAAIAEPEDAEFEEVDEEPPSDAEVEEEPGADVEAEPDDAEDPDSRK